MRLSNEVQHSIENHAKEIKQGEEGLLHRISLNNTDYYAKQWRGKHYKDLNTSMYFSKESGKSIVSPFWIKLKWQESKLINQALPELTLKVNAGYDPRISKDGKNFNPTAKLPVTLTKNVEGDPNLRNQRDTIIDSVYKTHFDPDNVNWDENGRYTGHTDKLAIHLIWHQADVEMQRQFGTFLDLRKHISNNTFLNLETTSTFLTKMIKLYENTDIATLLKAGVVPVHAEVNYIPTKKTKANSTTGVYIETMIVDTEKLKEAIYKRIESSNAPDPEKSQYLKGRIKKEILIYEVLRKLDELWDFIFVISVQRNNASTIKETVSTKVFQILLRAKEVCLKLNEFQIEDFFANLKHDLYHSFSPRDESKILEHLDKVQEKLKNLN